MTHPEEESAYHKKFLETGVTVVLRKPDGKEVVVENARTMGEIELAALTNGTLIPQHLAHQPTGELGASSLLKATE